jgi:hypothetical protein
MKWHLLHDERVHRKYGDGGCDRESKKERKVSSLDSLRALQLSNLA